MQRLLGSIAVVMGTAVALLGLLFLVGSGGQAQRLVVAALLIGAGAVAAGLGLRVFKKAAARSPVQIRSEIMDLAAKRNGEISEADLMSLLGDRRGDAEPVLADLVAQGTCKRSKDKDQPYFVFPDLVPRIAVRRCEFCGTDLPLSEEVTSCPQCGGAVKVGVERSTLSAGDFYEMDG